MTDSDHEPPQTLADLHELPWSAIEGADVRVRLEVDDRPMHLSASEALERQDLVRTEDREGEIVGREMGKGLYYSSDHGLIPDSIGPAIYLDTPEETTLEVRTDKLGNELLAFEPPEGGEDGGE